MSSTLVVATLLAMSLIYYFVFIHVLVLDAIIVSCICHNLWVCPCYWPSSALIIRIDIHLLILKV